MTHELRQTQDRQGKLIIAACVALITALFVVQAVLEAGARRVDLNTLCRKDRPLAGHTVVLIDMTDPLAPQELRQLRSRVESVRSKVPKGAMLSVFFITDKSADVLSERFCKCNPGDGSDANPLWSAPERIAKKWNTAFGAPLDSALEEASQFTESRSSPILESIRYVTERDDFSQTTANRKLLIVSDMLQHTERFSQYHGTKSFEEFRDSDALADLRPDLKGVDIEVDYLIRPKYRGSQSEKLIQFWRKYFANAGAHAPVFFRSIRGAYRAVATRPVGAGYLGPGDGVPTEAPTTSVHFDSTATAGTREAVAKSLEDALVQTEVEPTPVEGGMFGAMATGTSSNGSGIDPFNAQMTPVLEETKRENEPSQPDYSYTESPPELVRKTKPVYPDRAREAGVEGTVVLSALVGQDGRVKDVRLMKSIDGLDASAMASVKQWTFKPGMVNGKPLDVWVMIPIKFVRHF